MPANARLTDIWTGICCCHPPAPCISHSGPIITCSPTRNINNLGQARVTDLTMCWDGHIGFIAAGSPTTKTDNLAVARITDPVSGCNIGTIVTGSPDHTTDG